MIRIALALAVTLISFSAFAQSAAEFGRATGGEISVITKQPRQFSGSLQLSLGRGTGYSATAGGTALDDRIWFFASAAVLPAMQFNSNATKLEATDLKVTAQPVDWTTISASYAEGRQTFGETSLRTPTFLSLKSTSILSNNMTLDFSFSKR